VSTRSGAGQELLRDNRILPRPHQAHDIGLHRCTGPGCRRPAGRLDRATTRWGAVELLSKLGASYVPQRVVEHLPERILTAAGVSSGIDMARRLVELLVDREAADPAQLMIEYDPQPPFDSGVLAKADESTKRRAATCEVICARRGSVWAL